MSRHDEWFTLEVFSSQSLVRGYLIRRGLQPADAEDLFQEACLRILEVCAQNRPRSASGITFTIAKHLLIDHHRSHRVKCLHLVWHLDEIDRPDELDPERHTTGLYDLQALQNDIDALPPRRREVLWMRRIENRSLKEIAEQLGINVHTVEQHFTQAVHTLRAKGWPFTTKRPRLGRSAEPNER